MDFLMNGLRCLGDGHEGSPGEMKNEGIMPVYNMVDSCAGEFPARSPLLLFDLEG